MARAASAKSELSGAGAIAPDASIGRLQEAGPDHAPVQSQSRTLQETLVRKFEAGQQTALPRRWPVGVRMVAIFGAAGALWVALALALRAL